MNHAMWSNSQETKVCFMSNCIAQISADLKQVQYEPGPTMECSRSFAAPKHRTSTDNQPQPNQTKPDKSWHKLQTTPNRAKPQQSHPPNNHPTHTQKSIISTLPACIRLDTHVGLKHSCKALNVQTPWNRMRL